MRHINSDLREKWRGGDQQPPSALATIYEPSKYFRAVPTAKGLPAKHREELKPVSPSFLRNGAQFTVSVIRAKARLPSGSS
jgi:hypothetical protein